MYAHAASPDAGIKISSECIGNGTCKLEVYETLLLRTDTQ